MRYGPNTPAVERFIEQAHGMTKKQRTLLERLTWENEKNAMQAWAAAYRASRTLLVLTRNRAPWATAEYVVREAGFGFAVVDALRALVVRDKISEEHFNVMYGPWATVFGQPE